MRDLGRRFAALEGAAVFSGMSDHILHSLARRLQRVSAREGSVIIRQGDSGRSIYIIDQGLCQVSVETGPDSVLPIGVLGPGDSFAESSLLFDDSHPVTVRALKPTQLFILDRQGLGESLLARSSIRERLAKVIDQRRTGLHRMVARGTAMATGTGGHVIAVYSAKGGSGRTTLAVNLAATLALRHPGEVLLVDLALPYNHAALAANLTPTSSLASAAGASAESMDAIVMGAIVHHPAGMAVLPAALKPHEADLINATLVSRTLSLAARAFTYVVVDLGVALSEVVLTTFDHSHRIVLVTPPEIAALRDTKDLLEILPAALNVPDGQTSVLVNHRSRSALMDRKDVELILGRPVSMEILHDGAKAEKAALLGSILALTDASSAISKGTASLAAYIELEQQQVGARERAARHRPAEGEVALGGRRVAVEQLA